MQNINFMVVLPPSWHYAMKEKAKEDGISMSQIVRAALGHYMNLTMNPMEFDTRNPKQNRKAGTSAHRKQVSTQCISLKLPRYMEGVLKEFARIKDVSIATVVGKIIHTDIGGMPSPSIKRDLADAKWKTPNLDSIPKLYTISAYVPLDWMPVLQERARYYGVSVGKLVERAVLLRLQKSAVMLGLATQEELLPVKPLD